VRVVVVQVLNSLMDVFAEDELKPTLAKLQLLPALKEFLPRVGDADATRQGSCEAWSRRAL
jgi:hypothetical protein